MLSLAEKRDLVTLLEERLRRETRQRCESSLKEFVKEAWHVIDPTPFQDNWHIDAVCEHLEAVTRGELRFLLINLPPRCGKSLIVSVCWPVWVWLQHERSICSGAGVRFLCASYGYDLAWDHANLQRQLMGSPWFLDLWGKSLVIRSDADTKSMFANAYGGRRQSTSVSGNLIGFGGDVIIVDDPHNVQVVESARERESALRGFRELSSTRLNDPQNSPIVIVMQRLHTEDVSGFILAAESRRIAEGQEPQWCHLMIPMYHDLDRHCETWLGWSDPRIESDELMWPERFDYEAVKREEDGLGPYMASGRLQQSPQPVEGGIIKTDWWQSWEKQQFPDNIHHVLISVDTATGEKEINDWNAVTVWGAFSQGEKPSAILLEAWRTRAPLHLDASVRGQSEHPYAYRDRAGFVEQILDCAWRRQRQGAERITVLIENKTRGTDVGREIRRLMGTQPFMVELVNPKGDKSSRLHACVASFAAGMIWAPDKTWVDDVITEVEQVPTGKHDDLADTVSQAIIYLVNNNFLRMADDLAIERRKRETFVPHKATVADEYGA